MEISNNLQLIFNSPGFLLFLKFTTLIILAFYTIFALMIVRQVDLMAKTLITPVTAVVKLLSIIHAVFAIGLVVFAWITL